ncbi:LysE family transporter, partial [Acinetobacter baumannii]
SYPSCNLNFSNLGKLYLQRLYATKPTNLSNPKAVIYFGSVFSLFLANPQLDQVHWLLFIIVSVETILWFCFVTFIFSLPSFRAAYRNFSKWIDGISGGIFTVFGIFLIGNR